MCEKRKKKKTMYLIGSNIKKTVILAEKLNQR
jgi:hypothetical protein